MEVNELKEKIKKEIIRRAGKVSAHVPGESIESNVEALINSIIKRDREISHLTQTQQAEIVRQIKNEILGLGPIEELLRDPSVTEIMIDSPTQVCVERNGKIELTDINLRDEEWLLYFIDKILAPLGRRVTQFEPYVDARLKDGSRVNVIRSPLSLTGTVLTIRKFNRTVLSMQDLISAQTLNQDVANFLQASVIGRSNIIIAGGTSSGKTTTLNILLSFVPAEERIIIIEDTVELHLEHRFLVRLETRMPNVEGKGEVTIRELLKNSLHMRPDRIIVGEVRGGEVIDMLQAMNVGHEGSMTTIHANTPEDCLTRLEIMALIGQPNFTVELVKREIISALDLIIQQKRFSDGKRKIIKICEISATKKETYELNDIFVLDKESGQLLPTGAIPTSYPLLKEKANFIYKPWEKD